MGKSSTDHEYLCTITLGDFKTEAQVPIYIQIGGICVGCVIIIWDRCIILFPQYTSTKKGCGLMGIAFQANTPFKSVKAGALLPREGCKRKTTKPGTPPTPDLTCPETKTDTD
jgi:hypothetical protein